MDENETFPVDDQTFAALEREAPVLSRVRRYALGLREPSWFAHLGEAPTQKVRALSQSYVDALGFPDADLAILPTWEDAADVAETADWSSPAWEAEELARADLTVRALDVLSEEALDIALRLVAQEIGEAARDAMEEQAALWDVIDEAAKTLAVGAVAQAAHGAGLALIGAAIDPEMDEEHHAFTQKMALFEAGRWPVTLIGGSFSLF